MIYASPKGLIMVPHSRNTMTTQMLDAAVNLYGSESGPCGGRKEGPQGRKGSVAPLRCVNMGP